jgi:hypothetical protein
MRWIKKFEASSLSVRDDLKEFCEMNCAYLIDDDYKVMITRIDWDFNVFNHKQGYIIHFFKWVGGKRNFWEFLEVQDHFIPFLQRLSNQYEVIECVVDYFNVGKSSTRLSVDQVLNGGIEPNTLLSRVLIIVKRKRNPRRLG